MEQSLDSTNLGEATTSLDGDKSCEVESHRQSVANPILKVSLKNIHEIAARPTEYIIAHFIVTVVFLACAEALKFVIDRIEFGHERVLHTFVTVGDIISLFEVFWMIIILGCGVYEGFNNLRGK